MCGLVETREGFDQYCLIDSFISLPFSTFPETILIRTRYFAYLTFLVASLPSRMRLTGIHELLALIPDVVLHRPVDADAAPEAGRVLHVEPEVSHPIRRGKCTAHLSLGIGSLYVTLTLSAVRFRDDSDE